MFESKKTAYFRFYEELNDFLPPEKIKTEFPFCFKGNVSVKDAIESLGVPHTEIDLILVNGISTGFDYIFRDNDHISAYPVFESLDISPLVRLRPGPLRKMLFVIDVNLGKLARFMRMLGFDSLWRNDFQDSEIVDISVNEKRIILTRDIGILKNKKVTHGYWVRTTDPDLQIIEVVKRFYLTSSFKPFTRCTECNGILIDIEKQDISSYIPAGTAKYYNKFMQCSDCKKVYWEGSHHTKMTQYIDKLKKSCSS